ncbi:MAG: 30S ribosome-binding factor RbfA [Chlamydiota bacterium]
MKPKRVDRLNTLLQEVISEVIAKEVKDPEVIGKLISVTAVEVTPDLHHAKVYISIISEAEEKELIVSALNRAAGFIATNASKKVTMRYFPNLNFILDNSVEKRMKIDKILSKIIDERESRHNTDTSGDESES